MSARSVYAVALILFLTAGFACWCRAPMIWDGAYQFNATLIMQRPYFYLTRFHTFFLWWPTVWASRLTGNITILQTVYGLPFLLAPVLAVLISWWLVRKDAPHLIVWVIFGVAAGSLPGQIFVINDSIFQLHLFWPIFVGLFVPLTMPKKIVIAILAIFQFVHPLGVMLFFGATLAAALVAIVDVKNRRRLLIRAGVMAMLVILTAGKVFITTRIPALYDSYAAEEAKWDVARDKWIVGVRGWPLHGLWFMWSGAAMLFLWVRWNGKLTNNGLTAASILLAVALAIMGYEYVHEPIEGCFSALACVAFFIFLLQFRRANGPSPLTATLPLLCVAAGAMCWLHWAGDGRLWWKAIDYRRWVGPLTGPFMILATFDAFALARIRNPRQPSVAGGFPVVMSPRAEIPVESSAPSITAHPLTPARKPVSDLLALLLGVTFALVIGLQSFWWHKASARVMTAVRHYPGSVVPEAALPWIDQTPLDHWAISDYVMAMQGKTPRKLLLDPRGMEHIYENPPKIPHWDFYPYAKADIPNATPGPVGWFDLRPMLARLAKEPRPKNLPGTERLDVKSTPE